MSPPRGVYHAAGVCPVRHCRQTACNAKFRGRVVSHKPNGRVYCKGTNGRFTLAGEGDEVNCLKCIAIGATSPGYRSRNQKRNDNVRKEAEQRQVKAAVRAALTRRAEERVAAARYTNNVVREAFNACRRAVDEWRRAA